MKKKLTSVLLFLALSAGVVSAQTSKVTGKVIGEDGEPVIGASIIVKGTTVGTVTDFDGNFELEVPANGKQLVISYIGMKSQEVAATSNVNVKLLADTQNLDEVVVTAMGISKEKKALGYAVQDVKADELTKGANTSLSGALQGKVSGVEISPSSGMPILVCLAHYKVRFLEWRSLLLPVCRVPLLRSRFVVPDLLQGIILLCM